MPRRTPENAYELSNAGLSCSTVNACVAVGDSYDSTTSTYAGVVIATTDGGTTWTNQTVPSGIESFSGVSCASTADCVATWYDATSGGILTTTDGGTTWTNQTVPSGVGYLGAVSCASTTACAAVGYTSTSAAILTTTDGGTTWTNATVPVGVGQVLGISCASSSDCVAVGQDASGAITLSTTDGGTTWTSQTAPSGVVQLDGVSCASTADCVAVGYSGTYPNMAGVILTTTDGGTTWTNETIPAGVDELLLGVSCPSTTDCVVVGGAGTYPNNAGVVLTTTNGGTTWMSQSVPSGLSGLNGVSCASTADCVAAGDTATGGAALVTTDGGTSWTNETVPSGVSQLLGISCPSTTDCVAVGNNYDSTTGNTTGMFVTTTDGGTTWSSQLQASTNTIDGVSCASTAACVASGQGITGTGAILATTDGGTTWTSEALPSDAIQLFGASCASTSSCFAAGNGIGSVGGMIVDSSTMFPPSITTTTVPNGTIGSPYSAPVVATGGTTPYSWSVASGSLPNGLSLDGTTGVIAGVPTAAGTFSFTAEVSDATGLIATQALSITVAPESPYTPLAPTRICDTRAGNPSGLTGAATQCGGTNDAGDPLVANVPYPITVAGQFSVPADATAVVVNVTVVNPQNAGYLTVYPTGGSIPTASNVNFTSGAVVPNLVEVGLGTNGQLDLVANTATDVVVDLEGYVAPTSPNGTGSGLYDPLSTPARICDTRTGNPSNLSGSATQCDGKTLAANTPQSVQVEGIGGVPASGVEAVVVNVTVVNPTNSGYLTLYPQGTGTPPTASNVNFTTGEVVPNRVIVPVSASGALDMVANTQTDAIIDVSGWYSTSGGSGTSFTPLASPVRICDTRAGNPSNLTGPDAQCNGANGSGDPLAAGATHTITVTGLAGVPTDAKAVVLNVTAVSPTAATYLTVFPTGTPPAVSDLNPTPGDVEANLVVATVSPTGTVDIYNNAGSANVVVDVAGWYS